MTIKTISGEGIEKILLDNYFRNLVNRIFKILPMRENNEESLNAYLVNLRDEMLGCQNMIPDIKANSLFSSILFTLQYLIDTPECTTDEVRSKVFGSISICNKLVSAYTKLEVSAE